MKLEISQEDVQKLTDLLLEFPCKYGQHVQRCVDQLNKSLKAIEAAAPEKAAQE